MKYETEINFFIQLMKNYSFNITCCNINSTNVPCLDFSLRETYFPANVYSDFVHFLFHGMRNYTIYYYTDSIFCKYIGFILPDQKEKLAIIIGPYTNIKITEEMMFQVMGEYHIPADTYTSLRKYYDVLPYVTDESYLHASVNTLAGCIWEENLDFSVETRLQNIPDKMDLLTDTLPPTSIDSVLDMHVLEKIYERENNLLYIIKHGQIHKLNQLTDANEDYIPMEKRNPDPLRNKKNYLIILNTLLRKAAEQGGVHPYYINNISRNFALDIEVLHSLAESKTLTKSMLRKYCMLVHNHSTKAYSQLIQKVILQIDVDLTADLTLNTLASSLNVNASYLSTLFKKETSQTLTTYVNQKRINHAIMLLNTTNIQVQLVAQYCGIPDINYFTKLFKKFTGMTPSQYRDQIR